MNYPSHEAHIIECIRDKNIKFSIEDTRSELLEIVEKNKNQNPYLPLTEF